MTVSLAKTNTFRLPDAVLNGEADRLAVWWYGPITHASHRARTVPRCVVFLRHISADGELGEILKRETALTHLGLLRIGSVWQNGMSTSRIVWPIETFDISFARDGWSIVCPRAAVDAGEPNPLPGAGHALFSWSDRNHLLDFRLPGNKKLLVPCMEFLTRFYGRSAEVRRVLATYPWREAQTRLFVPTTQPVPGGTWPVKLARRMHNGDVVFLAHLQHDARARQAAKWIYSQIEAGHNAERKYTFLKVAPWFEGPASVRVAGQWIDGGRTFLGLRILGGSEPSGSTIVRDREGHSDAEIVAGGNTEEKSGTRAINVLNELPAILDLTDEEEPARDGSSVEVTEDGFETLGRQRRIIDIRGKDRRRSGGRKVRAGNDDRFSTGEPHGSGTGVGSAEVYAPAIMESQGVLRDVWDAARHLQQLKSAGVQAVHWYTFQDGFSDADEPRIIALRPFKADDGKGAAQQHQKAQKSPKIDGRTRNWVFLDPASAKPRGALVIRLRVANSAKPIYLFEIQRRLSTRKKGDDGGFVDVEESLKGMVFTLDNDADFGRWLAQLLDNVRRKRGVVASLTGSCPGLAYAYMHRANRSDRVSCEGTVKNAIAKVLPEHDTA